MRGILTPYVLTYENVGLRRTLITHKPYDLSLSGQKLMLLNMLETLVHPRVREDTWNSMESSCTLRASQRNVWKEGDLILILRKLYFRFHRQVVMMLTQMLFWNLRCPTINPILFVCLVFFLCATKYKFKYCGLYPKFPSAQ